MSNRLIMGLAIFAIISACLEAQAFRLDRPGYLDPDESAVVQKYGFNYGIKLYMEVDADSDTLLTGTQTPIYPIQVKVYSIGDSEKELMVKSFYKLSKEDVESEVEYSHRGYLYLVGAFDPSQEYQIMAARRGETAVATLPVDEKKDLQESISADERISIWIENQFHFDFALRPVVNQSNRFAVDFDLEIQPFKLAKILNLNLCTTGTFNSDDSLKNGFQFAADFLEFEYPFAVPVGNLLSKSYLPFKFRAGFKYEAAQNFRQDQMFGEASLHIGIPYTNIFSLLVHKRNNMLRAAPPFILNSAILFRKKNQDTEKFFRQSRWDVGGWYNLTLSPVLFFKLDLQNYKNLENGDWRSHQEYTLGLRQFVGEGYYFVKFSRGFFPPDFEIKTEETSVGVSAHF